MTIPTLWAATKRKQIDTFVSYLEERLTELDKEKEELKKYQQLDKHRRSIEYAILDHELNDSRNGLASVRFIIFVMYVYIFVYHFYSISQVDKKRNEGIGTEFDE